MSHNHPENDWASDPDQEPISVRQFGPARRTAYALAALGLDVVNRATVRALLPPGRIRPPSDAARRRNSVKRKEGHTGSPKRHNVVSTRFYDALKFFERQGWVQRGAQYVLVKDRAMLLDYALDGVREVPKALLRLDAAIEKITADLASSQDIPPAAIEQAHREIAAIRALMRSPVTGVNRSGRGAVRRVGPAGSGE